MNCKNDRKTELGLQIDFCEENHKRVENRRMEENLRRKNKSNRKRERANEVGNKIAVLKCDLFRQQLFQVSFVLILIYLDIVICLCLKKVYHKATTEYENYFA